jgi:glycosyltransferase involved in cell wall biosynthesis
MKVLMVYPYATFMDVLLNTFPLQLSKRGHDVYVATSGRSSELEETSDPRLIHMNSVNLRIPPFTENYPVHIGIEKMIRNVDPDVIHIHNLPFISTLQYAKTSQKLGISAVLHVHGVFGRRGKLVNSAQTLFLKAFGQSIFKAVEAVICLNNGDALEIQRFGCPSEKIHLIANGVDEEQFKPNPSETGLSLLWYGRFVEEKGLDTLIEAAPKILQQAPELRITLAGDGPTQKRIQRKVKSLNLSCFDFPGIIKHNQLPKLLDESMLFVLPSLQEGMPFSLLEAMVSGKPVVASDIDGVRDIITNDINGVLVPKSNPDALSNAIIDLLNNPEKRRRLGEEARRTIESKYTWKTAAASIEALYFKVTKHAILDT